LNAEFDTSFPTWNAFQVLPPDSRAREGLQDPTPWGAAWNAFLDNAAPEWTLGVHNLSGFYHERVVRVLQGPAAPRRTPLEPFGDGETRTAFLRGIVHPDFLRMRSGLVHLWRNFIEARYRTLDALEQATGIRPESWETLPLPASRREAGPLAADWL